jgi:hypothetical protein
VYYCLGCGRPCLLQIPTRLHLLVPVCVCVCVCDRERVEGVKVCVVHVENACVKCVAVEGVMRIERVCVRRGVKGRTNMN